MSAEVHSMKRIALILCVAVFALAQAPVRHGEIQIEALKQEETGPVKHLSGNVRIETDAIVLHADRADFNTDTHEIQADGNVRLKLK
jgi:lipopolysaccharide assembly outer membrane protein LptD (OstA)